jgi:hypothetical protein
MPSKNTRRVAGRKTKRRVAGRRIKDSKTPFNRLKKRSPRVNMISDILSSPFGISDVKVNKEKKSKSKKEKKSKSNKAKKSKSKKAKKSKSKSKSKSKKAKKETISSESEDIITIEYDSEDESDIGSFEAAEPIKNKSNPSKKKKTAKKVKSTKGGLTYREFVKIEFPKVKADNPQLAFGDVTKEVAKRWKLYKETLE